MGVVPFPADFPSWLMPAILPGRVEPPDSPWVPAELETPPWPSDPASMGRPVWWDFRNASALRLATDCAGRLANTRANRRTATPPARRNANVFLFEYGLE